MKAKDNRGQMFRGHVLQEGQIRRGKQQAADWMWFDKAEFEADHLRMIPWEDGDRDDSGKLLHPPTQVLIACGNLARIHFRAPSSLETRSGRHPRRRRDTVITFSQQTARNSFLCFDPDHPYDRLYMKLTDEVERHLAQRFWAENPIDPRYLSEWALLAGGHHARSGGYPKLAAKPLGVMTAVVYFVHKKGDGPSFYIHRMGEVSCHLPILACDEEGRLWVCGGHYTSPTPGITD